MTATDLALMAFYESIPNRPKIKYDDTITRFDRDLWFYDRDDINRQSSTTKKVTYEAHIKVIQTAVTMLKVDTQHDIAMMILTHRFFKSYRDDIFSGTGNFYSDYSFLVKKIDMVHNTDTNRVITHSIGNKLQEFKVPTLVQINYIAGTVTKVKTPDTGETLNEWAVKFNLACNSTISYQVAGLSIGA